MKRQQTQVFSRKPFSPATLTIMRQCAERLKGHEAVEANAWTRQYPDAREGAIHRIHSLYNKKAFETLYSLATERMRKRIAKEQFLAVIKHVRTTLGSVRQLAIIEQNTLAGGKREVLLRVRYDNGLGTERWLLRFTGNGVQWSQFLYHAPALTSNDWR